MTKWRDRITGLQLNRNRWFDSQLGRWLTRDPIGYEGGGNLYEYVKSKVIVAFDPFGEKAGPLPPPAHYHPGCLGTVYRVPCPPPAIAAANKECAKHGGLYKVGCYICVVAGRPFNKWYYAICKDDKKGEKKCQCACGYEHCDHKGNKSIMWEPSGKGAITQSECKAYCQGVKLPGPVVKYKWCGNNYDL